jgi:hypothetical protein
VCAKVLYEATMGLHMGLDIPIQKYVERLNDLNCYLLYFPEENPKQLDQDEIIDILDQAKAMDPEWHEAMVNANIEIFELSHEESVYHFKSLEILEKIRCSNGPNPSSIPVYNKKAASITGSVGKSSKNHKGYNMWCHYCDKNNHNTTDFRAINKFNSRKRLVFKPKLNSENSLWTSSVFPKKLMHLKGSCD